MAFANKLDKASRGRVAATIYEGKSLHHTSSKELRLVIGSMVSSDAVPRSLPNQDHQNLVNIAISYVAESRIRICLASFRQSYGKFDACIAPTPLDELIWVASADDGTLDLDDQTMDAVVRNMCEKGERFGYTQPLQSVLTSPVFHDYIMDTTIDVKGLAYDKKVEDKVKALTQYPCIYPEGPAEEPDAIWSATLLPVIKAIDAEDYGCIDCVARFVSMMKEESTDIQWLIDDDAADGKVHGLEEWVIEQELERAEEEAARRAEQEARYGYYRIAFE